jgi:hypothetical protein
MLVGYLSVDEVNRDLVVQMAAACGATVRLLSPKAQDLDGDFGAVLYDLESVPPKQRAEIVAELLHAPLTRPVAVHSYKLDTEADLLRDKGIIVARRLEPNLFRALCRSLRSTSALRPSLEVRQELDVSDLVGEITASAIGVAYRN